MKHLLTLLLACTFTFPCPGQSIIHLSPLLERDSIQIAIQKAATDGSSILFYDGEYILNKSIEIKDCKKGITIKSKNPGKVQFRYDKSLKGKLKPVKDIQIKNRIHPNAQEMIMEVDLSEIGINVPKFPDLMKERKNFPQLIYNNELLPLSRYPNKGYLYMKKVIDNFGTSKQGGTFEYSDPEHAKWAKTVKNGIWFTGYWRIPWQAWTVRIKEIDPIKQTVTHSVGIETKKGKDVGIFGGIGSKYHRPYGSGKEEYYVENLLEEIDQPGEWCIDFTTQKLYLFPPKHFDEDLLSIISDTIPLIKIINSNNIKIENISFKNHSGNGIIMKNATNCLIAGCNFKNILGDALIIQGGKSNRIQSNNFDYIGRTCIEVSGGNRKKLIACKHLIENNYFTRFGEIQRSYAPAVKLGAFTTGIGIKEGNAVGVIVRHNLVHNAPHAAFIYGGNNNIMEYNEVFDIARVTGDVGAFYSRWDWTSRGNVLRYNFIHHSPRANALYADDGHAGDSIYNNVIHQAVSGTIIGGGHCNYIHNNLYFNCSAAGISIDARGKTRNYNAKNPDFNHLFKVFQINKGNWDNVYPGISKFLQTEHLELPIDNSIAENIFINCHCGLRKEGKEEDFRYSYFGNNTNLSIPNLRFQEISIRKSLKNIQEITHIDKYQLDKCGLYIDQYRISLPDRTQLINSIKQQQNGFDSIKDQQITNNHQ
ncbi:right-handed parallel beta-helix repeat-containing protein [uncultured Bacteroides sp.]|uniref:right-handed parallel beta-helix repeat-containing protein n=1 Tax=uncultured Bacteroides sp. TaxID=162156 RepID=UPI002676B0D5|nr:right-handed parallel beta-helix repeat-containing protein [uncultured Bacteroides sp.]